MDLVESRYLVALAIFVSFNVRFNRIAVTPLIQLGFEQFSDLSKSIPLSLQYEIILQYIHSKIKPIYIGRKKHIINNLTNLTISNPFEIDTIEGEINSHPFYTLI